MSPKYAELLVSHHFVPVAIETSGVFGQEVLSFIRELGSCLQAKTGEPQSHHYMKRGIAVAMQRGNVVAVLGTMTMLLSFLNLTDHMCAHALAWCTNHHLLLTVQGRLSCPLRSLWKGPYFNKGRIGPNPRPCCQPLPWFAHPT